MKKLFYTVFILLVCLSACEQKKSNDRIYDSTQHEGEPEAEPGKTVGLNMGNIAPEISLPDPNGKVIPLSSLRGKVVLVDFWASWCGPCRRENPNNVALYQKYKDKGFQIYGVSLDLDKADWLGAIEADQLSWLHVSDLRQWNSSIVPVYQIQAIPATYLLDKEGKIIGKDLRGDDLAEALKQVFGS